jgi:hypothetical protein
MSQSNSIFFFLFAAFFVFITVRGELPKYMGFLLLSPAKRDPVASGAGYNSTGGMTGYSASLPADLSYNPANNSQSSVSGDIGKAALAVAKVFAAGG